MVLGPTARLSIGPSCSRATRWLALATNRSRISNHHGGLAMKVVSFSHPVNVFVGLGFPCEISSVMQACQVLDEWSGSRTSTYATASAVCHAALAGMSDVELARAAFEAFALARGILAPDTPEPPMTDSQIGSVFP